MVVNARKRGKSWEYRFELAKVNGKRKQVSKSGFRTKKEALEAGNKALTEYNHSGITFKETNISLSDFFDFWYENYVLVNMKYNTQLDYKGQIENHIKPSLGQYALNSLSPAAVQSFINSLKIEKGLSRSSVVSIKSTLSSALDYAVEPMKYIKFNPCNSIKLPKFDTEESQKRFVISQDDFSRIMELYPEGNHFHIPLLLGYYCGFRLSETFALTWDDIDLDNNTISINKSIAKRYKNITNQSSPLGWYFGTPKTKTSVRIVRINKSLKESLKREKQRQMKNRLFYGEHYTKLYIESEKDEKNNDINKIVEVNSNVKVNLKEINMVCRKENGQYLTTDSFKYCSRKIKNKLSVKFNYHSLRHTHTTTLLENGASIKAVQKRLGHSRIETTLNVYNHLTKKAEDETIEILENLVIK